MTQTTTAHPALAASGISATFAATMGVRVVTQADQLPDGTPAYWAGLLPGLVFPWTGVGGHVEWQLRPDDPGEHSKYLFRSGADGYQPTPWVLRRPVGDAPLILVEGTKQALCVAEHAPAGYGVIGLAGCWGGQERGLAASVLSHARGRVTYVILDADVRHNRQVFEAGKRLRAYLLAEGATQVRHLDVIGDKTTGIDDVIGGRTDRAEHLARLLSTAGDYKYPNSDKPKAKFGPRQDGILPSPQESMPCARAFLEATAKGGTNTLVWWREQWVEYREDLGRWDVIQERDGLRNRLYLFFEKAIYLDDGVPAPWNPGPTSIKAVEDALKPLTQLPDRIQDPHWLQSGLTTPPNEVLPFTNGLLHVPTGRFIGKSPKLFVTHGVPFPYESTAHIGGTRWERFLKEIFPNDSDSVNRLQEIMGYLISGRTDLQKIFSFIGVPRAGKGIISGVIREILGTSVDGPTVKSLTEGGFGLEPLLGKKLAILGDARLGLDPRRSSDLIESLLAISGGDSIRVARKYRSDVVGSLPVNFLIMSNEDLVLNEASGAITARFETLEFRESFVGREEFSLARQLAQEARSIVVWALAGERRLRAAGGRFTAGERVLAQREEMRIANSPIQAWADDRLTFDPRAWGSRDSMSRVWTSTQDLYEDWCVWAMRSGQPVRSSAWFVRDFLAAYRAQVTMTRHRLPTGAMSPRGYTGVSIRR